MTTATYADMDQGTLASVLDMHREEIAHLRAEMTAIESVLLARIRATGGKALPDNEWKIELEVRAGGFDPEVLAPLKETLPTADLEHVWTPAHQKTVDVPEAWDGRKLLPLARKLGGEYLATVERARLEGTARLVVERR